MRRLFFLLIIIIGISAVSCSPTKTIVDTSCPGYKHMSFNRNLITSSGLGVMPVLGGDEKEQFRRPMGEAITKHLRHEFGSTKIKGPQQVIAILNDKKLTDRYTIAINDYLISGIIPKDMVVQLGEALNVKYLLYTKLLSESESGDILVGNTYKKFTVNELYTQTQVWDASIGDVVWEGKGGSAKLPVNTLDLIDEIAEGLSKVIGNDKGEGPCETKQMLIASVQAASTNTYLATLGIGTAVSLLILLML